MPNRAEQRKDSVFHEIIRVILSLLTNCVSCLFGRLPGENLLVGERRIRSVVGPAPDNDPLTRLLINQLVGASGLHRYPRVAPRLDGEPPPAAAASAMAMGGGEQAKQRPGSSGDVQSLPTTGNAPSALHEAIRRDFCQHLPRRTRRTIRGRRGRKTRGRRREGYTRGF